MVSSGQNNTVINISDRKLTTGEESVLQKGLNFCVAPSKIPKLEIIASVECVTHKLLPEAQEELRWQIRSALTAAKQPKPNLLHGELAGLKALRKDSSIIILPADKGNATVVMNTVDYEDKVMQLISTDNYIALKKDPTASIERKVYQTLRKHQMQLSTEVKN